MPDEDNPFMVTPKKAHEDEKKAEAFGSDEMVSFMVTPAEGKKKEEQQIIAAKVDKPNWESSGTPIWDRKVKNVDDEDYEVVDHQ